MIKFNKITEFSLSCNSRMLMAIALAIVVGITSVTFNSTVHGAKPSLVLTIPKSDGILIHFAQQAFKEVSKRSGINISITELPKKRALVEANMGNYDGTAMRVINLEKDYPSLVRVKSSVFSVQHVLFSSQKGTFEAVHNFHNLAEYVVKNNFKVGYLNGSKKAKDELSQLPLNNKIALGGPIQAFDLLKANRINAYLAGPGMTNRDVFNKHYKGTEIQEVGVFAKFPLYPYLHKKHKELIPLLEQTLKAMIEDGSLNRIRDKLEKK